MKCRESQVLLSVNTDTELNSPEMKAVRDHLAECQECREWAAFAQSLSRELDSKVSVPDGLHDRLQRQIEEDSKLLSWQARLFGGSTMRKLMISTTTIAAVAAACIFLLPRSATASPIKLLDSVRVAFVRAAQVQGVTLNVDTEKNGDVKVTGQMNGKPLPPSFPIRTSVSQERDVLTVDLVVDFDPINFDKIQFGQSENELVLVPRDAQDQRIIITINPVDRTPIRWESQVKQGAEYKTTTVTDLNWANVEQVEKTDMVVQGRVRIYAGQDAEIRMQSF